jgi:DNA replication protein DnaC
MVGFRSWVQGRRVPRLFVELATARGEGRVPRMLAALERTRLLIIDDWGPSR